VLKGMNWQALAWVRRSASSMAHVVDGRNFECLA
jgi:hypothetical protein